MILILTEAEREVLRIATAGLSRQRMAEAASYDPTLAKLRERLAFDGDRVLVGVYLEGEVVTGARSNLPPDVIDLTVAAALAV